MAMDQVLDLDRYPLHDPESEPGRALVRRCRDQLDEEGLFNLEGFVRPQAVTQCLAEVEPVMRSAAFLHKRDHTIYFKTDIEDLAPDHPALRRLCTANRTVCADQIEHSLLCRIYAWPPLAAFLAAAMGKPRLFAMADPLARVNVMSYGEGEALNWHFDRSEFTTTLLFQSPDSGGLFEYRSGLRSDSDPNYDGVAKLLAGKDRSVRTLPLAAGTLNVFKGKNTAHRVTPVQGPRGRIIAVFSYYERPGVLFSDDERLRFYGRVA